MENSKKDKCVKCGKGPSAHTKKAGLDHDFLSLNKEREQYGWTGSEKLKKGIESGDIKKLSRGGKIKHFRDNKQHN